MSQIWVCECGHRWRAAGTVRKCPACGSLKINAVPEPSVPGGFTSVLPGNAAGKTSEETVAEPNLARDENSSETLAGAPVGNSSAAVSAPELGAEATLDHSLLSAPATGSPNPAPTVQPATEILERSGSPDTRPRSPDEASYATIATPPSTDGGGGETLQTIGGGASTVKKRVARPRSRMEDYEILGVLGRGGMGVVHKARHIKLDRLVALKMILAGSHAGEAQLARFQTEAEAVAQLQHPNIVQIYDIGEHNGQPFIALEFVDGGSLQQKLDGTPMPPRIAAEMVSMLARAVDYAHQRGVVHRDLKPANILLAGDWKVGVGPEKANGQVKKRQAVDPLPGAGRFGLPVPKITDFGLAKRTTEDAGQTGTGDILGTPSYMSPEQATGKNELVGPPADIYSLGAILYDLITGRPPFKGETVLDTLQQVQGREPVPPARLQPGVPRDLETICLKCLQKEPGKRYSSAAELADDLERFLEYRPIIARPTPWYERTYKWAKRRPAVAALLATLAVTLTGAFIGMFFLWRVAETERDIAQDANAEAQAQKKVAEKQRDRADANRDQAFEAAEVLLTAVANDPVLRKSAQMEAFRKELLVKAMKFYEGFYALEGDTEPVRYQVARAKRSAGYIQEQLGKRDKAREALDAAVALFTSLAREKPTKRQYQYALAGTHTDYAIVLQALDQPKPAEQEYREALRLFDQLQRAYPLETDYQRNLAATYQSYAGLLQRLPGRNEHTEVAYKDSMTWARKLHADYPKDQDYQSLLANILMSVGGSLIERGELRKAEPQLSESLGLWTDLVHKDRDQPLYLGRRAVALLNLGVVSADSAPAKAEEYYREAIAVGENLVRDFSLTTDYRQNLANCYTNLSLLLSRDNARMDEAAELRQKAIPHWEKLVDQDPKSADYRIGLAGCLHDEAKYRTSLGEKDAAIEWASKAVKRQEDFVAAFPTRLDFQIMLARGYMDLGQLFSVKGKTDQEQDNYRNAISTLTEIQKKGEPIPQDWAQLMADVHFNMGAMRGDRGEFKDAIGWFLKAVRHQREALNENPKSSNTQSKFVRYCLVTVQVQAELKDYAGASSSAMEALPTLKSMNGAKGAELFMLAKFVAAGLTVSDPEERKQCADHVVQIMQACVEQGFNNASALREPAFTALQGRADYDELLKKIDKR